MSDPNPFELLEAMRRSRHPAMLWLRFQWWLGSVPPKVTLGVAQLVSPLFHGRARVWRERLARPGALLVEDGGPGRPEGNWIGAVHMGLRGEPWPRGRDGRPMTPVVQMNLAESPFVPEPLKGVRLLTMYVSAPDDDYGTIYLPEWEDVRPAHGDGWCVRTYREGDDLAEVTPPPGTRLPRPMAARWEHLPGDAPNFITDVCDAWMPTRFAYDEKAHRTGTKVGGWPAFIQGAWPWRPWSAKPGAPLYLFQVHGGDGFVWGDAGAASVGIGEDRRWVITWQCY